jgi:ABC-2 type transport system permease protein
MASKETSHIVRDPRTLYLALVMPLVLLFLFGYGVSFDIDHVPLGVVDRDRTEASRALLRSFTSSREFVRVADVAPEEVEALFRRGTVFAALVVPAGYGADVALARPVELQLIVDGADTVTANQVLTKADAIVRAELRRLAGPEVSSAVPPIQAKIWTRYNPAGRSAFLMVPGLVVYLLAISAVLLTALTVAGEWERGSMEQLFASPVGRLEIVVGKLLPYLVLGLVEFQLVVAFGVTAFDLPVRGSGVVLTVAGFIFLIGTLGQGLLISVVAKNQLVATQAGALSALLPSLLLSGMVFPIENMPRALQLLSKLIPAQYLLHALRGILLKGNGLAEVWPDLLALSIFAVAIVSISVARFQRRLA